VLRSFVDSCQHVQVDPFAWFKDVLARLASPPINVSPSSCHTTGLSLKLSDRLN
jgi:hypothetical protein